MLIGQDKLTPQQWDNETLAAAIDRLEREKAERDPMLAKLERKRELDTWTQEDLDAAAKQAEEWAKNIKFA